MTWKRWLVSVLSVAIVSGASYSVYAFTFSGHHWENGTVITLLINLGPGSGTLIDKRKSWDQVGVDTVKEWQRTVLKAVALTFKSVKKAPGTKLSGDGRNSIFFADTVFGMAFPPGVAGITRTFATVPAGVAIESDIVMNAKTKFNSYRGPQLPEIVSVGSFPSNRGPIDFRRILLHEIGHLLGLNHPDQAGQRNVVAIMRSVAGDTDRLQIDDINGVYKLYGQKICKVKKLPFGRSLNRGITNSDCVAPHRPGKRRGDLYSFTATQGQIVTITMNRKTLTDPFLVLLGTNGGKLAQNNNSGGKNARISLTIPKTGKYTVEATTSKPTDRGTYSIRLG